MNVDSVTVNFGALAALSEVSCSVQSGQIVALIGPNGAGKTTLLNTISGLIEPRGGTITIGGHDVTRRPSYSRVRLGLGRTFQHGRLMDDLSVVENVLAGGYVRLSPYDLFAEWLHTPAIVKKLRGQTAEAMSLLESMDLADVADVEVAKLSFGRKKLVDIARALMGKPRLILMDEPTAGLSTAEIERLVGVVARIRTTAAVVLVAHHMGFVSEVADHVICLVAGRIIAQGSPRDVQANPDVLSAYMGSA